MLLVTGMTLLLLADLPAAAQMQIPNPLIRPRSLTNPATREPVPAEGPTARGAGAPPNTATALPGQTPEEIYARSLGELKDRFSTFYVSAIVGKQAILRRSLGGPRGGMLQATASAVGSSVSPSALPPAQPLAGGAAATPTTGRSDTLMISDGELLESVGSSGALIARINSRQVTIYLVQETMSLPNGKLVGKRAVIFNGEVENSGASGMPAIVLERPDPAYKRMITVDTRIRSTSAPQSDANGGASSGAATTPPAPPQ